MVSEIERLEKELVEARGRLKLSKNTAYCTVDRINAVAANLEKILSLRPGEDDTLETRFEYIITATRKMQNDYSNALWSGDRRDGRC